MRVISVINQKGGVGKSTSTHAIGAGLMLKGRKVLFVDLDAQGNLSYTLGADFSGMRGASALDVLENRITVQEAIQHTQQGDIIASTPALAGADTVLTAIGKEHRLRKALVNLKEGYDFVLIDTPPALGILTINALTASVGCIIPCQADIYSLQGVDQLYRTLDTVREYCNPSLRVNGILLTRYNPRTVISREVAERIAQTSVQMNSKLFRSFIRECTALKEAQAMKTDIFAYAPKSNAAADYQALVDEILEEELNHE